MDGGNVEKTRKKGEMMREVVDIKIKQYVPAQAGYKLIYYSKGEVPEFWAGDDVILWGIDKDDCIWPVTIEGIGLAYDNSKGILNPDGTAVFPHDRTFNSLADAISKAEAGEWVP